jgi:hypothetical protein
LPVEFQHAKKTADRRSWEVGSPEDGLLVLPEVGNPGTTP